MKLLDAWRKWLIVTYYLCVFISRKAPLDTRQLLTNEIDMIGMRALYRIT